MNLILTPQWTRRSGQSIKPIDSLLNDSFWNWIEAAMQRVVFGTCLLIASLANAQVWNDQSNGVTIKTMFVPLRKGSSSIPIPDFSKVSPLTTLNLPSLTLGDLQQASTLSQNLRSKGNMFELNLQSLQDLRTKYNNQHVKSELSSQVSNFPNFYQNTNFPQQQFNTGPYQPVENTLSHQVPSQHQFYQPESISNYGSGHHQNAAFQRNSTDYQYQNNGMSNENFANQDTHQNFAGGRVPNFYDTVNAGQQVYGRENVVNHKGPSDITYTHSHNPQHQVQVYDRDNSEVQENIPPQSTESSFSRQPSRYIHQMVPETATKQQSYVGPPNESSYSSSHQQMNYGIQSIPNNQQHNQHLDTAVRSTHPFQGQQNRDNRHNHVNQQLQQPVNTYAVVHQRIPTNSYGGQGNQGNVHSDQGHIVQYQQAADARPVSETRLPSHGAYINNEPAEYVKMSHNQEHIPMQVASQNHLKTENPQNSVENTQYPMKQFAAGNANGYHYNGHPHTTHVQIMMPRGQHTSSEGQYFQQQIVSPNDAVIRNQDVKSQQPQNAAPQGPYPDPSSETFYPENKQVYIAPPPDYGPQQQRYHQQQPMNEQGYMRYSSPPEGNIQSSQIPLTIQTGQLGIHVSIPNKNYQQRDSSNYSNVYA